MDGFGKIRAAALAAALALGGCSSGGSNGTIAGDPGSGGDPDIFSFSVTGTWVNLVPSCNGGPVNTGDEIQIAFPSDALTLGVSGGSCHAVFSGAGAVANPATGATVEDASMSFDVDLGVADCADAADITIEELVASYYEMTVLSAEDSAYPFECYGYRNAFTPVEVGTPVPILFECPHFDSGCPSLIGDGGLAAEFDIVTAIREAASAG